MDDLIRKVQEDIDQYELLPAARVVVGCSGGADSMALLFVLCEIVKNKYSDTELLVAHVNHGIRQEADHDEKVVEAFCKRLGVPFNCAHIDVPEMARREKMSLESAGRKARYEYFASLCNQYDDRIAVAHHMEDQAESIAMHIFRGCGMEGLVGIKRRNGAIIRPFLGLHKAEILDFCARNDIPYCQDSTNNDETYDRNFWRQVLFPSIQKGTDRDPVNALTQLASHISEENQYLDGLAEMKLTDIVSEAGEVPIPSLQNIPRPMLRRCLRLLAVRSFGDVVDMVAAHWEKILELVLEEREGYICLPGGRIAICEQGRFRFDTKENTFDPEEYGFSQLSGWVVPENEKERCIELSQLPTGETVNFSQSFPQIRLCCIEKDCHVVYNSSTWFFPQLCLEGAVLRTRREGDRFKRAGSSCSKELRRYMSELHIPARLRDRVLLVAVGNEILWIPGFAHAVGYTDEFSRGKCASSQETCWYELSLSERMLGTDEDITR